MTSGLRVLTYNVRSLRDDVDALVRVVRAADPDVVCVQEAPRFWRWRSRCAALARRCDLLYVAGGRTSGGPMLMTHLRVDVDEVRVVRLSKRPRLFQRGVVAARCTRGGTAYLVASVHMSLNAPERAVHAGELLDVLGADATPYAVLAGDLNEPAGGVAWTRLAQRFRDPAPGSGPTFPAPAPRRRIDAVLVGEGLEVVRYEVLGGADVAVATDHAPVLAEVRPR